MEDLVKAFFERDLNEAEEKNLDSMLESSQKEAFRLLETARGLYLQTGLPDPEKPLSGGPGGPSAWGGVAKVFLAFAAGSLATVAAWWASSEIHASRSMPRLIPVPTVIISAPSRNASMNAPMAPARHPSDKAPEDLLLPPAMIQPQIYVPGKKYDGLSAVVQQTETGLMTVRVLDGSGNEVRLLFAGILESGQWTFTWDGRGKDGHLAERGTYQVEIQSGKTVLRQEIKIVTEPVNP